MWIREISWGELKDMHHQNKIIYICLRMHLIRITCKICKLWPILPNCFNDFRLNMFLIKYLIGQKFGGQNFRRTIFSAPLKSMSWKNIFIAKLLYRNTNQVYVKFVGQKFGGQNFRHLDEFLSDKVCGSHVFSRLQQVLDSVPNFTN